MNDQLAPFSPFTPGPPPAPMFEGEVLEKKPRKKRAVKAAKPARKARTPKVVADPEARAAASGVPTRKRAVKQPRAPKFTLFEALQVTRGLQDEDCGLFSDLVHRIEAASKPARVRIVAALAKVFT